MLTERSPHACHGLVFFVSMSSVSGNQISSKMFGAPDFVTASGNAFSDVQQVLGLMHLQGLLGCCSSCDHVSGD